jgi:YD repeat-containing protein
MTTAKNSASNDIARYTYDADGHRTRRSILTGGIIRSLCVLVVRAVKLKEKG